MAPFLKRREPSKPVDTSGNRVGRAKPASAGQKKHRESSLRPVFVASPDWGSFRKFWTDCEMTITPYLSGFIDIEGGQVGISGKWFDPCAECSFEVSCSKCGRNTSNHLAVRAGDGDGIYSVFELHFESESVGALVILDEGNQFASYFLESISDTAETHQDDNEVLSDFYRDFYAYFYQSISEFDSSLEMHFVGDIEVGVHPVFANESNSGGILIFGETGEGKDSNQALVTIDGVPRGKYRLFIFGNRDEANNDILLPRILLLLEEESAESIGLTKTFAKPVSISEEYKRWGEATVFARIGEPLAPFTILSNINWSELQLAMALANENEDLAALWKLQSLSWLLLFQAHQPSSESEEYLIDSTSELDISPNLIHNLRGQFGRRLIDID
jgi:hypothetical protein